MEVKKTVCDVCGIELPVIDRLHRRTTRVKAKIKKINNEADVCRSKIIKLDLCEQCLYNLCTNRMESDEK